MELDLLGNLFVSDPEFLNATMSFLASSASILLKSKSVGSYSLPSRKSIEKMRLLIKGENALKIKPFNKYDILLSNS